MRILPHFAARSTEPSENGCERRFERFRGCSGLKACMPLVTLWLLYALFAVGGSSRLIAAEDCLSCHGPGTGMVNSQGKPITVNPVALAHSVHKDFGCVDCHAGAAKSGHTAKTASASCITCHDDASAKLSASAHAMLGDP